MHMQGATFNSNPSITTASLWLYLTEKGRETKKRPFKYWMNNTEMFFEVSYVHPTHLFDVPTLLADAYRAFQQSVQIVAYDNDKKRDIPTTFSGEAVFSNPIIDNINLITWSALGWIIPFRCTLSLPIDKIKHVQLFINGWAIEFSLYAKVSSKNKLNTGAPQQFSVLGEMQRAIIAQPAQMDAPTNTSLQYQVSAANSYLRASAESNPYLDINLPAAHARAAQKVVKTELDPVQVRLTAQETFGFGDTMDPLDSESHYPEYDANDIEAQTPSADVSVSEHSESSEQEEKKFTEQARKNKRRLQGPVSTRRKEKQSGDEKVPIQLRPHDDVEDEIESPTYGLDVDGEYGDDILEDAFQLPNLLGQRVASLVQPVKQEPVNTIDQPQSTGFFGRMTNALFGSRNVTPDVSSNVEPPKIRPFDNHDEEDPITLPDTWDSVDANHLVPIQTYGDADTDIDPDAPSTSSTDHYLQSIYSQTNHDVRASDSSVKRNRPTDESLSQDEIEKEVAVVSEEDDDDDEAEEEEAETLALETVVLPKVPVKPVVAQIAERTSMEREAIEDVISAERASATEKDDLAFIDELHEQVIVNGLPLKSIDHVLAYTESYVDPAQQNFFFYVDAKNKLRLDKGTAIDITTDSLECTVHVKEYGKSLRIVEDKLRVDVDSFAGFVALTPLTVGLVIFVPYAINGATM